MSGDVFEKVSNGYYHLTAAEKKVADYVILHPQDTQFLSISELAEACEVAEATVSRFCRRLRFQGYSGFKIALATSLSQKQEPCLTGEVEPGDSMEDLLQKLYTAHSDTLAQSMRLLAPGAVKQAVDIFCAARTVRCMGPVSYTHLVFRIQSSCSFSAWSRTGQAISTRRFRLRVIKSAEERYSWLSSPRPKQ